MGCGSSISSDRAASPIKKKLNIRIIPFSNIRILNQNLDLKDIIILSGDKEDALNSPRRPIISKNHKISVVLKGLSNFQIKNNLIFPLINYSILTKKDQKEPVSKNDYENYSQKGFSSSEDLKITLDVDSLEIDSFNEMNMIIYDKLEQKEKNVLIIKFKFKIGANQFNLSETLNPEKKKFEEIDIYCLDKLEISNLELHLSENKLNPPYNVFYGSQLYLECFGLKGFKKNNHFISVGCSMTIFNDDGNEIFFRDDMFPIDCEYHEDDVSESRFFVNVGGDSFKPNKYFYFSATIWDKNGPGVLFIQGKYFTMEKVSFNAKVFEIHVDNQIKTVRMKAENGFADRSIVFIHVDKNFADIFQKNLEKTVELTFKFIDGAFGEENMMVLSIDGIEKKKTVWKLISVQNSIIQ